MILTVSLHDALVRSAVLDRPNERFSLSLRAGDLQRGYVDVDLHYLGVSAVRGDPSIQAVLENERSELLENEVDVVADGGWFEHRFLFSPAGQIAVRFRDFTYVLDDAAGRDFKRSLPVIVTTE